MAKNTNVAVNESSITAIANALKAKSSSGTTFKPIDFASAVSGITTMSGTISVTNTNSVNVSTYTSAKITDSNLVTSNIKAGVTILGVAGKSSVVDTTSANAAAAHIVNTKTAYVNGTKVTGTGRIYVSGTTLYLPSTGWVN